MRVVDKINEVSPKILVIGDIMLDRFIFGNVHRISPEAPVPVVHSVKEKYSLGGSGNVLRNLMNLGVQASIISFVGKDQAGEKIIQHLKKRGIDSRPCFPSISTYPIWKKFRKDKLVNSKIISKYGLNLPSGVLLKENDIKRISNEINFFFK